MQQHMQNNDQNNGWKSRLEDVNAFDGEEIINGHAAWDALYNRLHKPRRKKATWYWMAAASIVAVVISVFLLQSPINQPEIISTQATTEQRATVNDIKPAPQNEIVAISPQNNITAPVSPAKKQVKIKVIEQRKKELTAMVLEPVEEIAKEIVPVVVPGDEKVPANEQLTTVQVKPSLKVVHVNELGTDQQNNIGRPGSDYSVLRIGTNNKTAQSAGKIGIQISTAKTSPVN